MALLERLEMMQIKPVEPLADLEQENAEDTHCDQDIQRNPELDDHRHAVGGAHGPEEKAVLHREKADTCDIALRVIIVTNDSSITATAMSMELRAAVLASAEIGCARPKANTTTRTPTSIVPEMLSSGSVSQ